MFSATLQTRFSVSTVFCYMIVSTTFKAMPNVDEFRYVTYIPAYQHFFTINSVSERTSINLRNYIIVVMPFVLVQTQNFYFTVLQKVILYFLIRYYLTLLHSFTKTRYFDFRFSFFRYNNYVFITKLVTHLFLHIFCIVLSFTAD